MWLLFLLCSASTFSQPVVDSIRYVDPDQSVIIIYLSEDVNYTPSSPAYSPDWVVTHDGVAYAGVVLMPQGALDPPNIIRLSLDAPISYSEAHTGTGIEVEYTGTGLPITGITGNLAAFGPTDAVNNLPVECEMFDPSRFDYSLELTEICAPAQVRFTVAYYVKTHYINSENYDPSIVVIRTEWGDGTNTPVVGSEVSPGKFETTFSHTYPEDPTVCYWTSFIRIGLTNIPAFCDGGGLRKTFTYENHSTDDEGDGQFQFHIDTIRVCLGQSFSETFTDATYFNCNPQVEPDFSNDGERYVRFTYGTGFSPEPRIQGIQVDAAPLTTPLQGEFAIYDSIRTTGVPARSDVAADGWHESLVISHVYDPVNDQVGQVFEIMMENWNPCNEISSGAPPIITYAYIKLVDGPIANPGPDQDICADESAVMAGVIERTATAGYWSTNTGDGTWTNADQPTGAVYTPGPNDIVDGGAWLVLTADDGAAGCPEHADSMFVTINPIPDLTLAVSDDEQCEGDPASVVVSNIQAGAEYTLRRNPGNDVVDGPLSGPAGSDITFGFVPAPTTTATYNVLATLTATGCDAELNDNATVTINPLADITGQPSDVVTCEAYDVTFSIEDDGDPVITSYQWQVSTDGTTWSNVSGANYEDGQTAVLTINSVPLSFDGHLYRVELTTGGPCTTLSNAASLTVNPSPADRTITVDDPFICYNGSAEIEIQNSVPGIQYTLRIGTADLSTQAGNNGNLAYPVGPLGSTTIYNVLAVNPGNGCSRPMDDTITVTVNPELAAAIPVLDNQCIDTPVDLPAVIVTGGSGTFSYMWTGTEDPADVEDPGPFTTTIAGTHTYTATVVDEGFLTLSTGGGDPTTCTAEDTETLLVHPLPGDRTVTVDNALVCFNTGTTLNIENSEIGMTYEVWNSTLGTLYGSQEGNGTTLVFPTGNLTTDVTFRILAHSTTVPVCDFELSDSPVVTVTGPIVDILADGVATDTAGICANTDLQLDGNPSPDIGAIDNTSHMWTEGPVAATGRLTPLGPGDAARTPVFNASTGGDYTYYYQVQDVNGCFAYDTIVIRVSEITANPLPASPNPCAGTPVNLNGNPSGGSGVYTTHTWIADPGNPGAGTLSDPASRTPVFTATTPGTYTFDYYVQDNAGCEFTYTDYTIVVRAVPDLTDGIGTTICSGDSTATPLSISNGPLLVTYSWPAPAYSDPAITGGGAGGGNVINDLLTNTGTVAETATYSVTPTANGCVGEAEPVVITVSPSPEMTSPDEVTICSEGTPDIIFNSNISATYEWEVVFVSSSVIGASTGETGTGNIPHTLINTGSSTGTVIYRVTPFSGTSCEGPPQNIVVSVNAPAGVTATNTFVSIDPGDPTPPNSTGLEVTLSGGAVQGIPARWTVIEPFPSEGTFDDPFSLNPIFTPSTNQEDAGYVVVQYITNDPDGATGPCPPDTAEVFIDIGLLPFVDAGRDTTLCFVPSIELIGSIGGAASTGTWSVFAGGGSGVMSPSTTTGTIVTATYTFGPDETGVDRITFRLETDDPDGAGPVPSTRDEKEVTIYPLPSTGPLSGPDTVCVNTPDLVYTVGLTSDSYYEWTIPAEVGFLQFGGTGLNSNAAVVTSAAVAGENMMEVFETNRYGCVDDTVKTPVVVLDQSPPVQVSGPDTVCAYATNVIYSVPDIPGSSYRWSLPPGAVITTDDSQPVVEINFFENSGQIRVLETNAGTCVTEHGPLDVTVIMPVEPLLTTSPGSVCEGEEVTITATPADALNYEFFVNDLPVQSGPSDQYVTSSLVDNDEVSVVVTTAGGCPSQGDPLQVTVSSLPRLDVQPVDAEVCEGAPTGFSGSASGNGISYQWMVSSDGGTTWSALENDEIYGNVNGRQLLVDTTTVEMDGNLYRLDVTSCGTVESDVAVLTVHANPTAGITGDLPGFPQLCGGEVLTMDGNPAGGSGEYVTHRWRGEVFHLDRKDRQTAVFESRISGEFGIIYQVTDSRGCIGETSVVVQNSRPIAQFTSDAEPGCGNQEVHFTNQSSADAVSFNWDFGNGITSTDEDPTQVFRYTDPSGTVQYYMIEMVATDAAGCQDTARSVITVYPTIDPEVRAKPLSGCQPLEVILETQPGAAVYNWDYGDGTGENGSYTTFHIYANYDASPVTYQTILQTTSAFGCTATDTVEITVDPIPLASFKPSPDIQPMPESGNAEVTFTNTTPEGPWTYTYDFGDGSAPVTTSSRDDVVHGYTASGLYTVKLFVSYAECVDSSATVVTVTPRPPEAGFTSITEGCHPLEVSFTNTSRFATSYIWQFGDGSVSSDEHPTHTFYQPGEFTVKLIANGPGGTDQASRVITVHATPNAFFNYAPDSVYVNDKPVRFFNLTTYADDYFWNFGDYNETPTGAGDVVAEDNTSILQDPSHIYRYEGWKDVLLIGWNEHCIDSLFIPMAIKVLPAGDLRFPNIFRPGDAPRTGINVNYLTDEQRNTIFFPGVNKQVLEYHMYIYNRWGELIFESNDINTGWDGFVQGTKAAQGVYIWKVTGKYSNGSPFSDAGDVTLVWQ